MNTAIRNIAINRLLRLEGTIQIRSRWEPTIASMSVCQDLTELKVAFLGIP